MANFKPLNNYSFYLLDKLISKYHLKSPFLDVGCGVGDLTSHLAKKGWPGKAIDYSDIAIKRIAPRLSNYPNITVEKRSIFNENTTYSSLFMWDVIEHIEDDSKFLMKANNLLAPSGFLVMSVPSNPREWRWDDEFYGHFRRYTPSDITKKLKEAGFKTILIWDFSFPVFWLMRRIYTRIKPAVSSNKSKAEKTKLSSTKITWEIPVISNLINNLDFLWSPVFMIQEMLFKDSTSRGFAMLVLAQKT